MYIKGLWQLYMLNAQSKKTRVKNGGIVYERSKDSDTCKKFN
jgi:hypothetical protein